MMSRVSRETQDKLDHYARLLQKWQQTINLVSRTTLDDVATRHFADSQQLTPYIDHEACVYDLGSGAGFPGLVLAMLRPDIDMHLIEADQRKCQFLRTVSRETNTDVHIHNTRIEALNIGPPDIVTARALTALGAILGYVNDWTRTNPHLRLLLLKGASIEDEIEAARTQYTFTAQTMPSSTGNGYVVDISDIKA